MTMSREQTTLRILQRLPAVTPTKLPAVAKQCDGSPLCERLSGNGRQVRFTSKLLDVYFRKEVAQSGLEAMAFPLPV